MKKVLALVFIAIFFGCVSAQSQLTHSWDEVDQAVTDVQNAQPIPAGKLVPDGGTTGQVLQKNSDANGDTGWTDQTGGGASVLKWNYPLFLSGIGSIATNIPWVRAFEDWKVASIVGRVDAGTTDVDILTCDKDGADCISLLAGPLTLTPTEQTFSLVYDGLMSDRRLEVALSNVSTATEVWLDAQGTYEIGTPPGATCDTLIQETSEEPSTEFILNDAIERSWVASRFTAEATTEVCKVALAVFRGTATPDWTFQVSIYTSDGVNNNPDSLIGTWSNSINAADVPETDSFVDLPGLTASIVEGTDYWIVFRGSATNGQGLTMASTASNYTTIRRSADGITWDNMSTARSLRTKLYQQ